MMGSLTRDVLSESALDIGTRSLRLQPSRSSSSRHGRKPLMLIEPLGRAKLRSIRRFARIKMRNVLANGCATMVDNGNVGVGTERSPDRLDVRLEGKDIEGAAIENARACPAAFVGGEEAGNRRVCVF